MEREDGGEDKGKGDGEESRRGLWGTAVGGMGGQLPGVLGGLMDEGAAGAGGGGVVS